MGKKTVEIPQKHKFLTSVWVAVYISRKHHVSGNHSVGLECWCRPGVSTSLSFSYNSQWWVWQLSTVTEGIAAVCWYTELYNWFFSFANGNAMLYFSIRTQFKLIVFEQSGQHKLCWIICYLTKFLSIYNDIPALIRFHWENRSSKNIWWNSYIVLLEQTLNG